MKWYKCRWYTSMFDNTSVSQIIPANSKAHVRRLVREAYDIDTPIFVDLIEVKP